MKHIKLDLPKIDIHKIDLHNLPKIDLHRSWELIKQYEHPSKETRDRIALLAGFQSWEELQKAFDEKEN